MFVKTRWTVFVAYLVVIMNVGGSFLPFENYRLNASVGGHVVFNCHLDFPFGVEIPYHVEWDKDGMSIFSWSSSNGYIPAPADSYGGRIRPLNNGEYGLGRASINLTSIRETDNGYYHCLVIFPNRTPLTRNNGTYYYLEVEGGNLIVTPPMNITTMEGERIEFECLPKSRESIIKWYKDGDPISDLMDLSHRSVLSSNGSLIIDPATMSDPGEYECRVVNAAEETQSTSAFLDVQYKAKVVYAPKERYMPFGKAASLDCFYRANPPLTNLRWEKDGFLFDPYNVPGVFYSRNGSLLFNRVDESHEGFYACTPYNQLGTEGPSPMIKVIVLKPPQFIYKPQALYLTKLGSSVTMGCGAIDSNAGTPPSVLWIRKDGLPLPEDRSSLNGGNITIDDVMEEDRGIYICEASNDADTVTTETEIMIENIAPRAPYNVTANATRDSIHVRWIPGHTSQRVDFHVWYKSTDVSDWRTMKILSLGVTEATIYNLRPDTEYEVMILSQDYLGDGLFSKRLVIRTTEDNTIERAALPSYMSAGPPTNVSAHVIDEGVLLTWAPPQYGADLVRRYLVRWYRGRNQFLQGSQHTDNTYFLLTDLNEDEEYSFVVYSVTRPGGITGNNGEEAQTASERIELLVPAAARVRTALFAAAGVALLLTVVATALYLARQRICASKDLTDTKCNGR